jgi:hypothetical protein
MFDAYCTACDKRQLVFSSQITSLANTDHGIEVAYTCWSGHDQTWTTGVLAAA